MVGGPAVGKAGDYLDWIAGGLEWKNSKILVTPVCFRQEPHIFDKFCFVLNWQDFRTSSVRHHREYLIIGIGKQKNARLVGL